MICRSLAGQELSWPAAFGDERTGHPVRPGIRDTLGNTQSMQDILSHHWHHLPETQAAQLLDTDRTQGLDPAEVKRRLEHNGPNRLTPGKRRSPWVQFLLQFNNPLIYLLIAAALTKLALGGFLDAAVILGVVLINAWIGHLQEAKAERAIEALAQSLVTETTVIRAGINQRIPASELVLGDIVQLSSGDRVPADIRLVHCRDLQVAEAALTGESIPVIKVANLVLPPETSLADRVNMAYASTLVTYGQARGIVVTTGNDTEIGRISGMIASVPDLATPLTRKMAAFGKRLLVMILGLAGIVVALGWARGESLDTIVSSAIALAVGAIPEGLPAAVTVTLAIGVSRLARRRAIVRKLPAVETLGSTTVICSDKTGTLTQNQMTVRRIVVGDATFEVTGDGYEPKGSILHDGAPVSAALMDGLSETMLAGLLCNDSSLIEKNGRWEAHGDPTEVALIVAARKAGWVTATGTMNHPRLDAIPFESQHQFMATLHRTKENGRSVYLKGAVEVVIDRCAGAVDTQGAAIVLDRTRVMEQVTQLASDGLRVLALARAEMPPHVTRLEFGGLPLHFTFLGLQGMIDPPRPEAVEAVRACQKAGIRVKMITGDHAGTAVAVGRQLGLVPAGAEGPRVVLSGRDLEILSDAQLIEASANVPVFARVTPEQKLRLVRALQASRHVVAMTGDGVNDGPALKQADIGVAMGITGTEVAKEAADMVLTDDNFASLGAAVEEGRNVYDNLTKIIAWALPSNLGQGLVILAASLAGTTLPILPLQVLWINMTTGGLLGLFLALEPKERDIMERPPRNPDASILTPSLLVQVTLVGVLILVGAFGLFRWELARGASLDQARTVALNVVAFIQGFYLLNCRSLNHSLFSVGLFRNGWLWLGLVSMLLLQVALTHLPLLNTIFRTAPLGVDEWLRILGAGFAALILVEIQKWVLSRFRRSA